jgi:hypothetical protein
MINGFVAAPKDGGQPVSSGNINPGYKFTLIAYSN